MSDICILNENDDAAWIKKNVYVQNVAGILLKTKICMDLCFDHNKLEKKAFWNSKILLDASLLRSNGSTCPNSVLIWKW
jgi:hypothetical protein